MGTRPSIYSCLVGGSLKGDRKIYFFLDYDFFGS